MDHHIHTSRCHHAEGNAEDYIIVAIKKGMKFIGFNEHFPMRYLPDAIPVEEYAMELDEFPEYIAELKQLRKKYKDQIDILISTEVDYFEPALGVIKGNLKPFLDDFDYLYGSVHVVDDWAVDDNRFLERFNEYDINDVWARYYDSVIEMVNTGLFDVVGHLDLPKKYEKIPTKDLDHKLLEVLAAIKSNRMLIELNTAGLRKPIKEIYPSRHILELCHEKGIEVTLGSDAHAPDEVGYDFPNAIALLKSIGYDSIVSFKKRERHSIKL
ncbi:MAG: histidinol-phosphatase HisJ [Candidatus Hodarchaeota archaeon]